MRHIKIVNLVLLVCLVALTSFFLSGCGQKAPYPVVPCSGTIYWKGEPLPQGCTLSFVNVEGGRESTAIVGSQGTFEAIHTQTQPGVRAGDILIRIGKDPDLQLSDKWNDLFEKYGMGSKGYRFSIPSTETNLQIHLK